MSELTRHTKRFCVTAVIKFHREIGVFSAASEQEAHDLAMETPEWYRASQYQGGIYDTRIEALSDETVTGETK